MNEDIIIFYGSHSPDHSEVRGDDFLFEGHPWTGTETVLVPCCGGGFDCKKLSGQVKRVVGIDVLPSMIDYARKNNNAGNIIYKTGDFLEFYLSQNHFDAVVFNWAIFHFQDKAEVLEKVYSCLKPGGTLFLSDTWTLSNQDPGGALFFEPESFYMSLLGRIFGKKEIMFWKKPQSDIFYRINFKVTK